MARSRSTIPPVLVLTSLVVLAAAAAAQERPPRGERWRGRMRPSPVLRALDADEDGALSARELAGARQALLGLDRNGDGNLETAELAPARPRGAGRRGPPGSGRRGPPPGFGGMMRRDPLVSALDKDGDGELFEDEVVDASRSLAKLDRDGDGALGADELRPPRRGPGGFGPPRGGFGGRRGRSEAGGAPRLPEQLEEEEGAATIPDRAAFERLAYQGQEVMVDQHLAGLQFVKFQLEGAGSEEPHLYFMNTKTYRAHPMFMEAMGLPRRAEGRMRGVLVFWPMLKAGDGGTGLYTFEFEPEDAFPYEMIRVAFDLLREKSPLLRGRLAYNLLPTAKRRYLTEQERYEEGGLPVFEEGDRYGDVAFLPLHPGEAFGRLRLMEGTALPDAGDVVVYPTLPNEMPRVAGVITAVRQTPLSHVNLRAIQDDVPNAFVAGATADARVRQLTGKLVRYAVTAAGWELREATPAEVERHVAALRPPAPQTPPRDLSVETIRPLSEIGFDDAASVGVKAANLGVLSRLDLAGAEAPKGWAIPFHFYVAFMAHNRFDAMARRMIATEDFKQSAATRERSLKEFRKAIKKGEMPPWMTEALAEVQARFPRGRSIRCRSSTNNEDLPGFSGAGLYDSFTHHPDEGHLSKSVKQVFASLWNFRAFEEREFYRIDHDATAMGVVLHENSSEERANGVAVTRDVLYGTEDQVGPRFYVNAQAGEDLVTNPGAGSTPEELLLAPRNPKNDRVLRRSSRAKDGAAVLDAATLLVLRRALRAIDAGFRDLYAVAPDTPFAMEVEFKVESDGALFIKQARPWVFR